MNAVVIRNPSGAEPVSGVAKADGSRYRFEMVFDEGKSRAYADTAADLLTTLIPGYDITDHGDRLMARIRYATNLLAPLQATVLADHEQPRLAAHERAVLLSPRIEPVIVEEWSATVPLVLVDVHYAPYTTVPAPRSGIADVADPPNIIWLRPSEEYEFLLSLDRARVVSLGESNDFLI